MTQGRLTRDRRGSTMVEFAVIGMCLCTVTFGILETGLLWWLRTGMEVIATNAARCGAVGTVTGTASPCVDVASTQNYAVNNVAVRWGLPGTITTSDITITTSAAGCNGTSAPGNFYQVKVTASPVVQLPGPLGNFTTMSVTGCYPVLP